MNSSWFKTIVYHLIEKEIKQSHLYNIQIQNVIFYPDENEIHHYFITFLNVIYLTRCDAQQAVTFKTDCNICVICSFYKLRKNQ